MTDRTEDQDVEGLVERLDMWISFTDDARGVIREADLAEIREALISLQSKLDAARSHAGGPVTWERLRTTHSGMRGTEPWQAMAPNEGHRVYKQGPDESCYMCAALAMIEDLHSRLRKAEGERDEALDIADTRVGFVRDALKKLIGRCVSGTTEWRTTTVHLAPATIAGFLVDLGSVSEGRHALEAALQASQSEAAALRVERDEAVKMLDRYDAPTLDDGDGGPLSIAGRIEAMVYANSLAEREAQRDEG